MPPKSSAAKYWLVVLALIAILAGGYYCLAEYFGREVYDKNIAVAGTSTQPLSTGAHQTGTTKEVPEPVMPKVTHVPTPSPVRGIYMTSWVASVPSWREKILKMIDDTELNALVIDVKDYTGVLAWDRAVDIEDYIRELHEHGVYVIGRVSAFQDQNYVKLHPELAVRRKDDGGVWRDKKGIAWLDAGGRESWDYIADVSKHAYALGFDEINLDYIRYPSDGDMENVAYTLSSASTTKAINMRNFYKYITEDLHKDHIVVSADLFGMTTTNHDDLGIGQVLENALPYFDYVCPMVYPSHFPATFNGWPDPNKVPGELIAFSMGRAVARAHVLDGFSSTTPAGTPSPTAKKLRPWLQDFDYGGNYGETEVRAQIQGTYQAGLDSWLMWDAGVKYTPSAYDKVASSTTSS